MTFKFIVKPRSVEIEFEAGSIKEGASILQDEATAISELFASCPWAGDQPGQEVPAPPVDAETVKQRRKPGPKPRNQPDPSTASAPPPMPVAPPAPPAPVAAPAAPPAPPPLAAAPPVAPPAPTPPNMQIPADGSIPPFLQRTPAPPAPVKVGGRLGPLVKAELDKRAVGSPDAGKAVVDWLAACGVVQSGYTYAEAAAVLLVAGDDELKTVAGQLGIS